METIFIEYFTIRCPETMSDPLILLENKGGHRLLMPHFRSYNIFYQGNAFFCLPLIS